MRKNKKNLHKLRWVASDDQPKIITRKKELSIECCLSSQTVSTCQTSYLQRHVLYFLKNRVLSSFSLFYTFGEFLAKSLTINLLNLFQITQKTFEWTCLVERRF